MSFQKSHKKKLFVSIFSIFIAVLFSFSLSSCGTSNQRSPYEVNTHWLSSDPYLSIKATLDISNLRKWTHSGKGTMIWNNETLSVFLEIDLNNFSISLLEPPKNQRPLLLRGTWTYDKDDILILTIEEDLLMNWEYETISLRPVGESMEALTGSPKKYPYEINSSWLSIDPFFAIQQQEYQESWRALGDTFVWNGESLGITTIMIGNKYYVACSTDTIEKGYPEVLFSGSWELAINTLILYVETDNFMDGKYQTILLKPAGKPIIWSTGDGSVC